MFRSSISVSESVWVLLASKPESFAVDVVFCSAKAVSSKREDTREDRQKFESTEEAEVKTGEAMESDEVLSATGLYDVERVGLG